jgi:hypothetical protein
MVIFGSSNWTTPSAAGQVEHNLFTSKPEIVAWFDAQFNRKWNNTGGVTENADFVPLPPDAPKNPSPAAGTTGLSTTPTLKWFGGPWAHLYDLVLSTNSAFTNPIVFPNLAETGGKTETSTFSFAIPAATPLQPGTTYFWKVVGKTIALRTKTSAVWTFTTSGTAVTQPQPSGAGPSDVVLRASAATLTVGAWRVEGDGTAAGGSKMRQPNLNAAKISNASATPADYFELTFNAEAGRAYRLWIRGKADGNTYSNDSVFVQFNNSVTSGGSATWRIGTTSATDVNLEDCSGCGLSGWGWQDNGWGVNVKGPLVYFATSGPQTIRIQAREDGFAIDQIVLSDSTFLNSAPGALKNDSTIVQ